MKRINLAKYGFVRTPEEDFSDDGTRFTTYTVGDVRVTKAKYEDMSFICGSSIKYTLKYDVYSKLPHFDAIGKLNGVKTESLTEKDLIDLYDACVAYSKEYDDAVKNNRG